MTDDEAKFDVRVRERLVQSGDLKESEIARHLEGLKDVGDQAVAVVAKQPALQSESDRDIVIVRTSGVRPPPTPPRLDDDLESTPIDDDLDDDDLDDDDDDDEDEATVVKKAPVIEKPVAVEKPEPAKDTDDDDDEDDKKEKEKLESEDGEKPAVVDDDWGDSTT
jgi:hypothetical protein